MKLGTVCDYRCDQCKKVASGYVSTLPAGWVSRDFSARLRWEDAPIAVTRHFCSPDCAKAHVQPFGWRPDWVK